MQAVQNRYTRDAWSAFARTVGGAVGARYQDGQLRAGDDGLLPLMPRAVDAKAMVGEGNELAAPIMLGGEVIGVLGASRQGTGASNGGWSEEERMVVAAAVDQLSQTIEALRLLDRMQRVSAREQLALQVSEQVRSARDIEEILRVASQALGRQLKASEVLVRLGTEATLLDRGGALR
jgi:GAF domain-containing protein